MGIKGYESYSHPLKFVTHTWVLIKCAKLVKLMSNTCCFNHIYEISNNQCDQNCEMLKMTTHDYDSNYEILECLLVYNGLDEIDE
jgi:hypothetical protein